MTTGLRKEAQISEITAARLLSSQTIDDPGIYNITSGKTVIVSANGEVTLNYGTDGDLSQTNNINPQDVLDFQKLTITGFASQDVLSTQGKRKLTGAVELIELVINLVPWEDIVWTTLAFAAGASQNSSEVNTIILLDDSQSIMLTNVNQSYLTENNFIFYSNATSDDNQNNIFGKTAQITTGVVGGISLLTCGYFVLAYYTKAYWPFVGESMSAAEGL